MGRALNPGCPGARIWQLSAIDGSTRDSAAVAAPSSAERIDRAGIEAPGLAAHVQPSSAWESPMCMFTGPVASVAATRIFARLDERGRQWLVYSMRVDAPDDVAMVLPVPVAAGAGENALEFIDLRDYPTFFADLEEAFAPDFHDYWAMSWSADPPPNFGAPLLKVVAVGSFEASYVPSVADFARLDPRFQLPEQVWEQWPAYRDYGFAVFKLRPGHTQVHPMAFVFPSADPQALHFPTTHVHDGEIHPRATFDHVLYGQLPSSWPRPGSLWRESRTAIEDGVPEPATAGPSPEQDALVDGFTQQEILQLPVATGTGATVTPGAADDERSAKVPPASLVDFGPRRAARMPLARTKGILVSGAPAFRSERVGSLLNHDVILLGASGIERHLLDDGRRPPPPSLPSRPPLPEPTPWEQPSTRALWYLPGSARATAMRWRARLLTVLMTGASLLLLLLLAAALIRA
jgi:hypothetical protein